MIVCVCHWCVWLATFSGHVFGGDAVLQMALCDECLVALTTREAPSFFFLQMFLAGCKGPQSRKILFTKHQG